GQACQRGSVTGLCKCILDERVVGLVGVRDLELRLRDDFDVERPENAANLANLAFIAAGEDELFHSNTVHTETPKGTEEARSTVQTPSPDRCAATSRLIPDAARSSIVFSSVREKGFPSAVPCTSTRPPWPVMTMFMSVSQAESSE